MLFVFSNESVIPNKLKKWKIKSSSATFREKCAAQVARCWFSPSAASFHHRHDSRQQLRLPLSCVPVRQRRAGTTLKPFSCCSAITCRVFTLQPGPLGASGSCSALLQKHYMRAIRDWCSEWAPFTFNGTVQSVLLHLRQLQIKLMDNMGQKMLCCHEVKFHVSLGRLTLPFQLWERYGYVSQL